MALKRKEFDRPKLCRKAKAFGGIRIFRIVRIAASGKFAKSGYQKLFMFFLSPLKSSLSGLAQVVKKKLEFFLKNA